MTLRYFETGGGTAVQTRTMEAQETYANIMGLFLADANTVTTGTVGEAAGYMIVCGDTNIDGFGMLSMLTTSDGVSEISLAQGYAARLPVVVPDACNPTP